MNDELKHYGVLGMKWGIRRDKPRSSKPGKKRVKDISEKLKKKRLAMDLAMRQHMEAVRIHMEHTRMAQLLHDQAVQQHLRDIEQMNLQTHMNDLMIQQQQQIMFMPGMGMF